MKALKIILYVLAGIIFFFGAISLITIPFKIQNADPAYRMGYYFGRMIFFIIPIFLFLLARSIGKKMRKKATQDMLDSLPH